MTPRTLSQYSDVLHPVSFQKRDPAGTPWPTVIDIQDLFRFCQWVPDPDNPSYPWGWAWFIERTRLIACEDLAVDSADWTALSQATNPRIAAGAALFALLRPERPPFRTDRQFLEHVAGAFDSAGGTGDPYRDAIQHICNELQSEIEAYLEFASSPPFLYMGPLPPLHFVQRICPLETSWPAYTHRAMKIVRSQWKIGPSWLFARAMIGSARSAAAVLAARFAESIRSRVSPDARSRPDYLLESEARAFAHLAITEHRDRGFLADHIRWLATTRHIPGGLVRTRQTSQTGTQK